MSHEKSDVNDDEANNIRMNDCLTMQKEYTNADRSRYFDQLETWLQEIYAWQGVIAMFPHYLVSSQMLLHHSAGTLAVQNIYVNLMAILVQKLYLNFQLRN